jgi:hypothetical protein
LRLGLEKLVGLFDGVEHALFDGKRRVHRAMLAAAALLPVPPVHAMGVVIKV